MRPWRGRPCRPRGPRSRPAGASRSFKPTSAPRTCARPAPLVIRLIGRELRSECLPAGTFADLEPDKVILAKTASRSVLGGMNEMAFQCEHAINGSGGLSRTDLAALNHWLRRNINSARGYQPPIEPTAARLAAPPVTERADADRHPPAEIALRERHPLWNM